LNRFFTAGVLCSGALFAALVLVQAFVRAEKLIPEVAVSSGQIIYALNRSTTSLPVETGYKITVTEPGFSPTPSVSRLPTKSEGAPSSSERQAKEKRRPPSAAEPQKLSQREVESAELLNPYIIENIVKSSDKTYYFTEKSITRSGVTVELLSLTPRKDDYFLKFRINNASKVHFIPQAFAVKHGDDWVDAEKFFKHILQDGESQVGHLRVKASASMGAGKDKMFQLNESGGGFRKYSIFY